ncbi:MAG: hypothetical protein IPP77_09665 [Bacteroidetes bacterium]|nr:hypothetical protein [Bacteroidota bacterium]
MKTIQIIILATLFTIFLDATVNAQGWIHDKKGMYSAGLGVTQVVFLPYQYYPLNHLGSGGLSLNIAGEYKVHRFIGIGWQTGINVFVYGRYYNKNDKLYYNAVAVGIPIGFKANFHILEATRATIKDRLDVYAGLNVGGGPSFHSGPKAGVYGFIYGGPQVGARYWFKKVAVFGEIGWGATIANIGVTF